MLQADYAQSTPLGLPAVVARRRNGSKMSHLVAAELRRQIVRGQIAPGDTLPNESQLMKVLDVSRDTLREALRMLESESLIYIRRGRNGGAVVRRPDLRAISRYIALLLQTRKVTYEDIHEARLILEGAAVELLAHHVSPRVSERLPAIRAGPASNPSEPLGFAASLVQFDQGVVDLTGNGMLSLLAGIFRDSCAGELFRCLNNPKARASSRVEQILAQQAGFVRALRNGNTQDIAPLWAEYLRGTRRLLLGSRSKFGPIDVTPMWRAEVGNDRGDARVEKIAPTISVELRSRIAEGRLTNGDKLPALPDLAADFGVSRPTLREALRILERESLLDLRTGSRGGAHIRVPSTEIAAQLAAIIIETEQTTIGDLWEARSVTEPRMFGLVASRIPPGPLSELHGISSALAQIVSDTPAFSSLWSEAEKILLQSTGNPAITVAMELADWIRAGCRNELTAAGVILPWVERSNRRAARRLNDVLDAATRHDSEGASTAWNDYMTYTTPFFQNLGDRLILDMLD